ncbi:PilN domain-containing protein [Diaphorobacter ruginosibacter]|uniref:PilN domain-containing protein n=1 Tax=Diaphorobacter ruginosibacter TaxID=1715720 RepID=UPI003341C860
MPIASDDLRLFGLDLRNLWRDLKSPWVKLASSPSWSWIAPQAAIHVKPDAGQAGGMWEPDPASRGFRHVSSAGPQASAKRQGGRFEAVIVPEHLILRKRLFMPRLDGEHMSRAIALEAANSSPFQSSDLAWGYAIHPKAATPGADVVAVDMVVASRSRIAQHFGPAVEQSGAARAPEVWALLPDRNDMAMLIPGYGESARAASARRYWGTVGALAAVALALVVAIAVTPYLQLRARVMQANAAYGMLDQRAAPQLAKRAALLKAEDEVKALADIIGHRLDTLQVIQMLTNALPDDTVLQRLQLQDRKVMIAGDAADAAGLMQKLGSLPQVREVRPLSATTRRPGMVKDSFQIEFQLTDDFGVSAGDAAVATALAPSSAASAANAPAAPASGASAASGAASAAAPASAPASAAAPAVAASAPASAAAPAPNTQSQAGGKR